MDHIFDGVVELTHRCNFDCVHCYNPKAADKSSELSLSQWDNMFAQMAKAGICSIRLTGGEIFVRRDFCEIYTSLISKGIKVSLETNASFIGGKHFQLFKQFPPIFVDVSLYGFDQATFQDVTKVKVPYERALNNVERLVNEIDTNVRIRSPLLTDNFRILPNLQETASKLGIRYDFDEKVFWAQDGRRLAHLRCSSAEIDELAQTDARFSPLSHALRKRESEAPVESRCAFGIDSFFMNPYGELYHCNVFWATKISALEFGFEPALKEIYRHTRQRENDYCTAKHICGTGGKCPSGTFYANVTDDMSQTLSDRLRSFVSNQDDDFDPASIGLSLDGLKALVERP